jgi:hypothetical protein
MEFPPAQQSRGVVSIYGVFLETVTIVYSGRWNTATFRRRR